MGPKAPNLPDGSWRVRIYKLREDGQWDDEGTGYIFPRTEQSFSTQERWNLCVFNEKDDSILLNSPVSVYDIYSRQGETIISWQDPDNMSELALSFQQMKGCQSIWDSIQTTQSALGGPKSQESASSDKSVASEVDTEPTMSRSGVHLPELKNEPEILEETLMEIRTGSQTSRDKLVFMMVKKRRDYLRTLFSFFREAEEKSLKDCLPFYFKIVREILLLAETSLYEAIIEDEFFLDVVGTQEYDPGMRYRPHHRDFLKDRVSFKQVVPLDPPSAEENIHKTFRLSFLRDVLIPRAMDDPVVNSLNSLLKSYRYKICTSLLETDYLKEVLEVAAEPTNGQHEEDAKGKESANGDSSPAKPSSTPAEDAASEGATSDKIGSAWGKRVNPTRKREDALLCLEEFLRTAKATGTLHIMTSNKLLHSIFTNKNLTILEVAAEILRDPASSRREILSTCEILHFLCTSEPVAIREYLCQHKRLPPQQPMEEPSAPDTASVSPENISPDTIPSGNSLPGCTHYHLSAKDRLIPFTEHNAGANFLFCLLVHLIDGSDEGIQTQVEAIIHSLWEPDFPGITDSYLLEFVASLYDHYWSYLVLPFAKEPVMLPVSTPQEQEVREGESMSKEEAAKQKHLKMAFMRSEEALKLFRCERSGRRIAKLIVTRILAHGVRLHSFRAKYFLLRNNLLQRIMRLLYYPTRDVAIAAIDLLRALLEADDIFYDRYITKHDLLVAPMDLYLANPSANNLVSSSIVHLFHLISKRSSKSATLAKYLISRYEDCWSLLQDPVFNSIRETVEVDKSNDNENDENDKDTAKLPLSEQRAREVEKEEEYFESEDENESPASSPSASDAASTPEQEQAWGGEKSPADDGLKDRLEAVQKSAESERQKEEQEPEWFAQKHKPPTSKPKHKGIGIHISLTTKDLSQPSSAEEGGSGQGAGSASKFLSALGVGNSPRPGKTISRSDPSSNTQEQEHSPSKTLAYDMFSSDDAPEIQEEGSELAKQNGSTSGSSAGKRATDKSEYNSHSESAKRQRIA